MKTARVCAEPGCPEVSTGKRCTEHALAYERKRGSSTQRGYGKQHQNLRKQVAQAVQAGITVCAKCHEPIQPGEPWDLGHTDDRTAYTGPEHAHCNRSAGGKQAH